MKNQAAWALAVLLAIAPVSAANIADYPNMFFDSEDRFSATIVKGTQRNSAEITALNLIINDLPKAGRKERNLPQGYYRYRTDPVPATTVIMDDQTTGGDEIVIGTPCGNSRVRELLNIPLAKCKDAFGTQQGLIKLVEDGYGKHLVITGSDSSQVLDAAKILTNPRHRINLRVKEAPIRRIYYRTSYQIGNGDALDIGQTIGAVTPAIYQGYPYKTQDYRVSTYGAVLGRDGAYRSVTYRPSSAYREMFRHPQNGVDYYGTTYGAVIQKN
jgi:hypothetical protein